MISKYYRTITLGDIGKLIKSPYNEFRHLATMFIKKLYHKNPNLKYKFLVRHIKYINNWNLVDCIASVFGHYSYHTSDMYLNKWISTSNPWKVRLCVVSMFYYIKKGNRRTPKRLLKKIKSDHQLVNKSIKWLSKKL